MIDNELTCISCLEKSDCSTTEIFWTFLTCTLPHSQALECSGFIIQLVRWPEGPICSIK
jgi:hypothetical protein